MKLYRGKRGKFIGAVFEGKKMFVWHSVDKKSVLSRAKTTLAARNDFKELVAKAKQEYEQNSLGAEVRRAVGEGVGEGADDQQPSTSTPVPTPARPTPVPRRPQVVAGGSTVDPEAVVEDADDDSDTSSVITQVPAGGGLATDDVVSEVGDTTADILEEEIQNVREDIERQSEELRIPLTELREIRGILDLGIMRQVGMTVEERTDLLGVDIEYWDKRADDETEPAEERFYRSVARVGKLTKDYIRVRNGLKPESDEALGIVKEVVDGSDVLRLERFKRWAKKNMIGISAVAISVAGLITGIVVGARGALKAGARGLGRFAGAVARVFRKLAPLFAALGSLISTALSWGARGILWPASNLWFLAVVIAVSLYGAYSGRGGYGRRRQASEAS